MSSMKYPYRDLGVPFDRKFRNDLNANFDDIEHDIRMIGGEAAQQALEAAEEANTQAIYAQTSGDYANDKGDYAAQQGDYAQTQGIFANEKGLYAQQQGDYAKAQGDYAKQAAENNIINWLSPVNTYADIATTYPNPQLGDLVQTIDDSKIYRWDGTQWVFVQQYDANAITDIQNKLTDASRSPNVYEWIATAGQVTYTLPEGTNYDPTTKWLEVFVGGAPVPDSLIQKDSPTQFTLLVDPSDIPEGIKVIARWVETYVPATSGHASKHYENGTDPIDVTKLMNYKSAIDDRIGILNEQLMENASGLRNIKYNEVELIAHRGFAGIAPENTLTAFSNAIALGANIECDVHFTSDGYAVVIHDDTVDRTTNGTGNVKNMTLAEIQSLDAGSKFDPRFSDTRIPLFEDVVKLVASRTKYFYPEFKGYRTIDDLQIMVNIIKQYGIEKRTVLCSTNINHLQNLRQYSTDLAFGLIMQGSLITTDQLNVLANDGKCVVLQHWLDIQNNPIIVSQYRSVGVDIVAWTPPLKDNAITVRQLGVNKIITDYYWGDLK